MFHVIQGGFLGTAHLTYGILRVPRPNFKASLRDHDGGGKWYRSIDQIYYLQKETSSNLTFRLLTNIIHEPATVTPAMTVV